VFMADPQIRLETTRLILLTAVPSFAPMVVQYLERNRAFFEPWLPELPADYYTIKKQRMYIEEDILFLQQEKQIRFFLFRKEDTDTIVGDLSLSMIITGAFQSCTLGYKLAEKENNKGYMTEAIFAAVAFAFNTLKLHRIEANIIPGNEPSIRVIEKAGFKKEGLSPKYLKINGEWQDHVRYATVNTEDE
jgi:ribosomal-protein-alanine N-acetyltransferase